MASDVLAGRPSLPLNLEDEFCLVEIQPGKPQDTICCRLFTARDRNAPNNEAFSCT
jgi:hypothetical protein